MILAPALPAGRSIRRRRQLSGKLAHQRLIGRGIHPNLFLRQPHSKVGCISRQLAARRFRRGGDFLPRGLHNLSRIFFSSGVNTRLLVCRLPLCGVAHHANFPIQSHQAKLNLRQPAPRFIAGFLCFLHRLLDGRCALAEQPRQVLARCPEKYPAHPPPVAARGARFPLPASILALATPTSPFPCPIRYPAWPPEPAPELFCALPLLLLPAHAEQPAAAPLGCGTPSLEPRVGVAHTPWCAPRQRQYRPALFPPPLRSCCGAPPRPVAAASARLRYTSQTATSAESRSVLTRAAVRLAVAASRPWGADMSRWKLGLQYL